MFNNFNLKHKKLKVTRVLFHYPMNDSKAPAKVAILENTYLHLKMLN